MPENYIVILQDLKKKFKNFTAVNQINLKIRKGEIFGFLGPNGAGKSTTIRMLCGLIKPTSGSGIVAGIDITKKAEKVKSKIGYMSQKFSLYEDLTIKENLDFYAGIYQIPRKEMQKRKDWALSVSELTDKKNKLTASLPAGWKQKLALACAVMHKPEILFLDEPTSGVDPITRRKFWDLIYKFSNEGVTIFVTTHYMQEAEYCHRLGMIFHGNLIATGTPEELKKNKMDGILYELYCKKPYKILSILENEEGINNITLFGSKLHFVVDESESNKSIIKKIKNLDIEIISIEKIAPSLENVFISLTNSHKLKMMKK